MARVKTTGQRPRKSAALAASLALLWLLALPAAGAAAAQWLAPAQLSPSGHGSERAEVAMDPHGDAVSVWEVLDGKTIPGPENIETAVRVAGAFAWQPRSLLETFSGEKETAADPQVALDAQGDAVAAWESFNGTDYVIKETTRSGPSGAWPAPTTLKNLGMMPTEGPDLAVNAAGAAVIVWAREEKFVEAVSGTVSGAFSPAEELSKTAAAQHATHVGIDAAGDATAVWENTKAAETRIFSSTKPAGGAWSTAEAVSGPSPENANEARIAVDARDDAVALWERPESGGQELLEAATRPAGKATWSAPVALTKTDKTRGEPAGQQVAIDGNGDAVAVWSRTNSHNQDLIEASEANVAAPSWNGPVVISAPGGATEESPQTSVSPAGAAIIVWERSNGANEIIEAASGLATSQAWAAPVALSAPGQNALLPQVSLDERGDATAVWQRSDGATPIVEGSTYDLGPQLSALSVPATGTAGQALAFSVSPLAAVWPLASTSWSFGDGTTATGTAVSHAYTAPGTYPVTVTATDTAGGSNSATATLTIAAKPAPPLAPKIRGAHLTHSRFRVSSHATAVSARVKRKAPLGTSFRFSLSEAAKLKIVFTRSAPGLRSGKHCLAPSRKLKGRHAKRCTRTLTVGTLLRTNERSGADTVAFTGRIGKKPLPARVYTAVLTASASGLTSTPVKLALTVVR